MPYGTLSFTRLDTGETRTYPSDTSFEPYRREAMRRRTISVQRESVDLSNEPGRATLATEGTWRREMLEWSMGAGQFSLDRKDDDNPRRFYSSKGIDVFTYPQRATLLPDTQSVIGSGDSNILISQCGDYLLVASSGVVKSYNSSYAVVATLSANTLYGGTAWSTIYSMCSNDTYCYIGTDTGLWFALVPSGPFYLYALPDAAPYGTGYTMVRWANDQLLASCGPRLYAFQPRVAPGQTGTTAAMPFGSPPSVLSPGGTGGYSITQITNLTAGDAGYANLWTNSSNTGLVVGQQIAVTGSVEREHIINVSLLSGEITATTSEPHGFVVGQTLTVLLRFNGSPGGRTETVTVDSVGSQTSFTYSTTKIGSAIIGTGFLNGEARAAGTIAGYGYNQNWTVYSIDINDPSIVNVAVTSAYGFAAVGGTLTAPNQAGIWAPDVLVTHENPNWVWVDATSGQTQVYYGGYVLTSAGTKYGGAIFRSDLLGSSTSAADGIQSIASASVAQPWMLDTPVQCLPMSPDEYPTCVKSYLNYIFVGTNRGIRMCQTLSIYDPTATATGDLKAGPLIPNQLQPVQYPVTAIVGDGRYVWFAWNNYDSTPSTGLGKLDLQTFIPGDDLAPAYASDLMYSTAGIINSLEWDSLNNYPVAAIASAGVYVPYATNEGGNLIATKFVLSGTITSSYFDYGISAPKVPVYFDYGVYLPATGEPSATGVVTMDPLSPSPITISVPQFISNTQDTEELILQTGGSDDRARQFQVALTLVAGGTGYAESPTLFRWTLKAWPTEVQGTLISAVLAIFTVDTIDGIKYEFDPEEEYNWLESLRYNQTMLTFTDGETSVFGVIATIDDIPHKAQGIRQGFEGDFVVDINTLGPFTFTANPTE